jgi:hypothetical protein
VGLKIPTSSTPRKDWLHKWLGAAELVLKPLSPAVSTDSSSKRYLLKLPAGKSPFGINLIMGRISSSATAMGIWLEPAIPGLSGMLGMAAASSSSELKPDFSLVLRPLLASAESRVNISPLFTLTSSPVRLKLTVNNLNAQKLLDLVLLPDPEPGAPAEWVAVGLALLLGLIKTPLPATKNVLGNLSLGEVFNAAGLTAAAGDYDVVNLENWDPVTGLTAATASLLGALEAMKAGVYHEGKIWGVKLEGDQFWNLVDDPELALSLEPTSPFLAGGSVKIPLLKDGATSTSKKSFQPGVEVEALSLTLSGVGNTPLLDSDILVLEGAELSLDFSATYQGNVTAGAYLTANRLQVPLSGSKLGSLLSSMACSVAGLRLSEGQLAAGHRPGSGRQRRRRPCDLDSGGQADRTAGSGADGPEPSQEWQEHHPCGGLGCRQSGAGAAPGLCPGSGRAQGRTLGTRCYCTAARSWRRVGCTHGWAWNQLPQ